MSRIYAAVDGSAAARPVLLAALALGEVLTADVEAAYVGEQGKVAARAVAESLGVPFSVFHGSAIQTMIEQVAHPDVAAVVIGARATAGGRRPLGRTAAHIAAEAHKPVLIVPPQSLCPRHFRRIVVGLDPKHTNTEALDQVLRLLRGTNCALTAIHIHDESTLPLFEDQPYHHREAWLHEFGQRHWSGHDPDLVVEAGVPYEVLLTTATTTSADAILLGWNEELMSDADEQVRMILSRTSIPTLLVPARSTARTETQLSVTTPSATRGSPT